MIKKFYEYDFGGGGSIDWRKEYDRLLKERNELKAEINHLTMENMTHEYNQAEAEKYAPEFERQIREDEREKMKAENERLSGLIEKAFYKGHSYAEGYDQYVKDDWQQFCKENNL